MARAVAIGMMSGPRPGRPAMSHDVLIRVASILAMGVAAQWLGWRSRVPSILLLLLAGITAGPLLGFIDPDALFGPVLPSLVSLSVAVILFEGGMSLRLRELKNIGGILLRLITLGALVSWSLSTLAAHLLLGLSWPLATLMGAILIVTGPTVVGPLLRHLRLRDEVGMLLKWEGIVIDPLGAILALMVFTIVDATGHQGGPWGAAQHFAGALVVGAGLGGLAAGLFVFALRRYWIPDALENAVSLALVVAIHTAANALQAESGLLAVTVMGIVLANQRWVAIHHLLEFKENLSGLLIACLFVVLGSRLGMADLTRLGAGTVLFPLALVFVARPLSVAVATWGSALSWRKRLFVACIAPRGIVAVAVSSVFAMEMADAGFERASDMIPATFSVVFGTVLFSGLVGPVLARRLGLVAQNPQGVLMLGAHAWARSLALALKDAGCTVRLVDTHWLNVTTARLAGLDAHYGSIFSEDTLDEIDFGDLGRLLALTSNDEVNSLACVSCTELFGRREVYQLPLPATTGRHQAVKRRHRGRFLFGAEASFDALTASLAGARRFHRTRLSKEFDYATFRAAHGGSPLLLFCLKPNGNLLVGTAQDAPAPGAGDVIICLVPAEPEATGRALPPGEQQVAAITA